MDLNLFQRETNAAMNEESYLLEYTAVYSTWRRVPDQTLHNHWGEN